MKADRNSVTRNVRGQLEGIQKMIDEDRYCVTIADQILASSALLKKAAQEVLEAHIRSCVRDALQTDEPNEKIEEALAVLEKMTSKA